GVGSTQLSNHLNAYGMTTNLLTDTDTLRHSPWPPEFPPVESPTTADRCQLPPGANPHGQAQKTCGSGGSGGGSVILSAVSAATFPPSLEEYVARGDGGGRNVGKELPVLRPLCRVLVQRYERMFDADVAMPLFQLLCSHKLSPERIEQMAAAFTASRKPRCSQVMPELYDKMYGDLLAEMDRLPPLYVRVCLSVQSGIPSLTILTADRPCPRALLKLDSRGEQRTSAGAYIVGEDL
ncbi:hypothetical protein VOLCADRAFT_94030, partial [Volvox carteri f. nagariensis]